MKKRRSHFVLWTAGGMIIMAFIFHSDFILGQTKRIRPEGEPMIVTCKALINPADGQVIQNAALEIAGGKILRVGKADLIKASSSFKVVAFNDKFIIPGLIDTHGHLYGGVIDWHTTADMIASLYLACGVTSVRAPGSLEPERDMGLRFRIDSGRTLGPRLFLSGPYIDAAPPTLSWVTPVKTPEEVRLTIESWIKRGSTSVKIYASMKNELLKTAINFGHAHGVKIVGHVKSVSWKDAMAMGLDELSHGVLALPDIIPKRNGWKKGISPFEQMDLSKQEFLDLLKTAAQYKVVMTPTAGQNERLDENCPDFTLQKQYFTPEAWAHLEESRKKPPMPGPPVLRKNLEFIRVAHAMGCILSTGTDRVDFAMLPGFSLWKEMEIFAQAGLSPMDVLKAATANGAFTLGRSDLLGSLEGGKLADFVVLEADPLEAISNVRKVHRVVKDGVIFRPEDLLMPLIGKIY